MTIVSINCGGKLKGPGIPSPQSPFSIIPFAAYLFSQEMLDLFGTTEGKDIVGERDLVRSGSPLKSAKFTTTSRSNGYTAPFTGRQLADSGGSQSGMTVITIARCAPALQWAAWGDFSSNSNVGSVGLLHNASRVRFLAALPYTENFIAGADANRGVNFAFYAHALSTTRQDVYARNASESSMVSAKKTVAMTSIGSANMMAVGHDPYNASWTDPGDILMQVYFSGALSDSQIGIIYEESAALAALVSIDI